MGWPLYLCDPSKNTECSKTHCMHKVKDGLCFAVDKLEYSKDGIIVMLGEKDQDRYDRYGKQVEEAIKNGRWLT